MEVNALTASLPARLGNVLGIGIPLLIYKNTLKKKYEEEWKYSTHGKIKYWCWIRTLGSLFFSLTPTFNELLFVAMNESQIRFETIYRSSQLLIGYNVIIFVIGFVLKIFTNNEINYSNQTSLINENNFNINWQIQVRSATRLSD